MRLPPSGLSENYSRHFPEQFLLSVSRHGNNFLQLLDHPVPALVICYCFTYTPRNKQYCISSICICIFKCYLKASIPCSRIFGSGSESGNFQWSSPQTLGIIRPVASRAAIPLFCQDGSLAQLHQILPLWQPEISPLLSFPHLCFPTLFPFSDFWLQG